MKPSNLHQTIIHAAQKLPDDTRTPYQFHQRILHQLKQQPNPIDPLTLWSHGLWKATIPCLTLMLTITLWTHTHTPTTTTTDPLATDLQLTMLQPFDQLTLENLWQNQN